MNTIIAHTREQWLQLAAEGHIDGIRFLNNENGARERHANRYKVAYVKEDLPDFIREDYQNLANFLGKTIYATGSSIRGYFRLPEVEEEISKKYNLKLKYSDLDFKCDEATDEEIEQANEILKPVGVYQRCNWERYIEFQANNK